MIGGGMEALEGARDRGRGDARGRGACGGA